MPRHETLSDEAIEVRSVLMRLHHSRQMGEAFYPAAFVNGHAPQMEADGWIERCGQGWRLTDVGLKVWARMNPELIAYKYQYGQHLFDEMRRILRGEDEVKTTCSVDGCVQPRMISKKGEMLQRCEMHQREYWRVQQAAKTAKKKAAQPPHQPSPVIDKGSPDPLATYMNNVTMAAKGIQEAAARAFPEGTAAIEAMLIKNEPVAHDCETCEAKAIIAMLRARSPKLAALIDAMEETQRKAAELGL